MSIALVFVAKFIRARTVVRGAVFLILGVLVSKVRALPTKSIWLQKSSQAVAGFLLAGEPTNRSQLVLRAVLAASINQKFLTRIAVV